MASPKWKIKGLTGGISFKKAAFIILIKKIDNLNKHIIRFLKTNSADDLHDVRISLRRLRYNMELFYDLFDYKKFLKFYTLIEKLQDQTGNVRDTYILKLNILLFENEDKIRIPKEIILKLDKKEKLLKDNLLLELSYFKHSAELKSFTKLLK
jgi:CHAD domain-containing protein